MSSGNKKLFNNISERLTGIETRLTIVEGQTATSNLPKARNWRDKISNVIKSHKVPTIALIVAIFAALYPVWKDNRIENQNLFVDQVGEIVDEKLAKPLEEMDSISGDIRELKGELNAIRTIWEDQLRKSAELTPQEFRENLPQLAMTMRVATALRIQSSPEIFDSLRNMFLSLQADSPDYWQAVSRFISYRSHGSVPDGISFLLRLPNYGVDVDEVRCTGGRATFKEETPFRGIYLLTLSTCVIDLGNPGEALKRLTPEMFVDSKLNIECRECIVKYDGGPISANIKSIRFVNCLFLFSGEVPPTQNGKKILRSVLEGTPSAIDIEASG